MPKRIATRDNEMCFCHFNSGSIHHADWQPIDNRMRPSPFVFQIIPSIATNVAPQVIEQTKVVLVTNSATGAMSGHATREPVATDSTLADQLCDKPATKLTAQAVMERLQRAQQARQPN